MDTAKLQRHETLREGKPVSIFSHVWRANLGCFRSWVAQEFPRRDLPWSDASGETHRSHQDFVVGRYDFGFSVSPDCWGGILQTLGSIGISQNAQVWEHQVFEESCTFKSFLTTDFCSVPPTRWILECDWCVNCFSGSVFAIKATSSNKNGMLLTLYIVKIRSCSVLPRKATIQINQMKVVQKPLPDSWFSSSCLRFLWLCMAVIGEFFLQDHSCLVKHIASSLNCVLLGCQKATNWSCEKRKKGDESHQSRRWLDGDGLSGQRAIRKLEIHSILTSWSTRY